MNRSERRMSNKYKAQKKVFQGRTYHSKKEADFAHQLEWQLKAGAIRSWNPQHSWNLVVNGKKICRYIIDFKVEELDGTVRYIEIKGAKTHAFTIKWKLVQALWDELTEGEDAELWLNDDKIL